jgi:hypothetical protein
MQPTATREVLPFIAEKNALQSSAFQLFGATTIIEASAAPQSFSLQLFNKAHILEV